MLRSPSDRWPRPSVLTIGSKEVILPSSRTWNEALSDKEGTDAVSEIMVEAPDRPQKTR
jgi:hypothetical protein